MFSNRGIRNPFVGDTESLTSRLSYRLTNRLDYFSLSRVLSGRVLDLFTGFTNTSRTVADKSGEGNDATLYSGRYISTDGVADKAINADCSAAGSGYWRITGKVKPAAGVATIFMQTQNEYQTGVSGLTPEVWHDFSVSNNTNTAASNVGVGFAYNDDDPQRFSSASWSDIRLWKKSGINGAVEDDVLVARWQLNESADGDLNGYPALDSSGNGYHGTHTGCAGGTGEGIDADVVGAAFAANEDKMYFDDSDDTRVAIGSSLIPATGNFDISFTLIATAPPVNAGGIIAQYTQAGSGRFLLSLKTDNTLTFFINGATSVLLTSPALTNEAASSVRLVRVSDTFSLYVDGALVDSQTQSGISVLQVNTLIGSAFFDYLVEYRGINGAIYDISFDSVAAYSGTELVTWTDTIGSNNGTVNGSPVTVGQKRETILQTAGMDWNKYYYPDASWDSSGSAGFSYNVSFTENSLNGFAGNTSSNFGLCMLDLDADVLTGDTVSIVLKVNSFTGATPSIALDSTQAPTAGAVVSNVVGLSVGIQTINLVATGTAKSIRVTQNTSPSTIDVEWFMITTSNGGTAMLSPASDATPTNDALGNAIAEPRPTAATFNPFGDGEYGLVADADSLDLTTEATWELWGNFYGADATKYIFSKYAPSPSESWRIFKLGGDPSGEIRVTLSTNGTTTSVGDFSGIPDDVAHLCFVFDGTQVTGLNRVRLYVNGVDVGDATIITNIWPASLLVTSEPVRIGVAYDLGFPFDNQISRPKIYSRALTAAEVLQNFNAQKSSFGL